MRPAGDHDQNEETVMKKLLKPKTFNAGDKKPIENEAVIDNIDFNIFKNNNRPKPQDKRKVLIISCLSEFGCEIVGCMYCLPRIMQKFPGHYKIAVGWHGREYLYRHLVDEFWEMKEEHQWLREYCRAFHHESKNLKYLEQALSQQGTLIESRNVGQVAVGNRCRSCNAFWGDTNYAKSCPYCKHRDIVRSLFADISYWKPQAIKIPIPSESKQSEVKSKYLSGRSVGVFARGRRTYGRNLQPEFYVKLIAMLESKGYTPIWLGEKQSTQPCPVSHIVDFSRMEESRDLETTLAIVAQCEFTFQAYTASTRLASMVGVPYLLVESPDQIWGHGQEGFRRNLCDFNERKLLISHYLKMREDNGKAIQLIDESIEEMKQGNYEDKFGMLESDYAAQHMKRDNDGRIGGCQ